MTLAERFWAKVRKTEGCWEWTASVKARGYGQFQVGYGRKSSAMRGAHRVAWELAHGPIPEGMQVCHRCDNRRCVRVDHLFLGTPADNSADMVAKGRQGARRPAKGELNPSARLSDEDVRQIRCLTALGVMQTWVASTFGIDRHYVYVLKMNRARAA